MSDVAVLEGGGDHGLHRMKGGGKYKTILM